MMAEAAVKLKIIVIVLLFFSSTIIANNGSTTAYRIELAGVKIGNLYTNVQEVNGITTYQLASEVDVWLFIRIKISYKIIVKYDNEKMVESKVTSFANGDTYYSNTIWNNDHYDIDCHTYKYDYTAQRITPIKNSLIKLYFQEPVKEESLFSENYGVDTPISDLNDAVYQAQVQGNKNKYFYEKGILTKAEMQSPIKNYLTKKID